MKIKKVVFILLNYKQCELTLEAIKNILSLEGDIGIIVIDNNSKDASYEKLYKMFQDYKDVQVFQSGENSGYANGNNLGVKKANEIFNPSFLAIINPDVRISDKKIVIKLLKAFGKNDKIAVATGLMLDINKKLNFEGIAWKIPRGFDDIFLNISFLRHLYNPVAYKSLKMSKDCLFYVEVVPGSFFIIKRDVFEKIAMFDEKTFLMCEERILGWKLKKEGFISALVPDCFFSHNHYSNNQSLFKKNKLYFYLIKSRFYYNLMYNSSPRLIILPFFLLSALLGYIEKIFIFIIKSTLKSKILFLKINKIPQKK